MLDLHCNRIQSMLIPGRSTEQALLHVHLHLRQVRDQCLAMADTLWARHAGNDRPRCRGGITLSLDLSNAFDTVDRADLAKGMQHIALPADLQQLLMQWLIEVTYFVQRKQLQTPVSVTRGIRQGCVASPFLWLMWSIRFLSQIEQVRSYQWLIDHICLYADDIISQWVITTYADFCQALRDIGLLLDALEDHHLTVSLSKSVALMRLIGTARASILKRHSTRQDGKHFLLIPRKNGQFSKLLLVKSHKYLGTILSYSNPEELTLSYRLKAGQHSFFRLIKFLGRKNHLPFNMKKKLWLQCIQSTYLYGLFATGLTQAGCTRLCRRLMLDLRRLTNCWAHLTHVSNLELVQSLKMLLPIDELQVRWHRHYEKQQHLRSSLDMSDAVLCFDLEAHWNELYLNLSQWYHANIDVATLNAEPAAPEQWHCPFCNATFAHRMHMRQHITKKHKEDDPVYTYIPARDSQDGMPQCTHCHKTFHSRHNLRLHIEKHWCLAFNPDAQVSSPLENSQDLCAKLRARNWAALTQDNTVCQSLVHNCGLCQHWCAQTNSLAAHLKKIHHEDYQNSLQHRPQIVPFAKIENRKCSLCHNAVHQQHTCPVVVQLAIMHEWLVRKDRGESANPPGPDSGNKRKSAFDGAYMDSEVQPMLLYDARRDCLDGRNQCAHCSQQFGDHIGLKRRIDLRRCLRFQASKPPQPWVLSHNEDTMDLMLGLHPHLWIADETLMKRLALCGRKFDTPPSLMLHIEHEHGREHRAAQPYAAHLLRYFHMAGAPCLCGQWLPPSITHNCVVTTQLGILRQKASQITPRPIHAMIPCLMDQWLTEDDMESVLSHPEYEYIFTNYCGVCLTRVHSAGDLWDHLEHYHDHMMAVS